MGVRPPKSCSKPKVVENFGRQTGDERDVHSTLFLWRWFAVWTSDQNGIGPHLSLWFIASKTLVEPGKIDKGNPYRTPYLLTVFSKNNWNSGSFQKNSGTLRPNKRTFNTFEPLETKPCVPKIPIAVAFAEELDRRELCEPMDRVFFLMEPISGFTSLQR